ncbi:FecR family protein [Pinibacter soli]|uniref:FecR domain-containing protein n=1 Tax=Pinibacter soli TaxID=3044211 RepID=A0ABT6RDN0_9BACT|nr:FecR domain-containing protein [Pinibacter soli]MDI3320581.1 FecR domain-containing protein [Pinibacter soli]
MKQYRNYTVEDILLDDDFLSWVHGQQNAQEQTWARAMEEHPQLKAFSEEAKALLGSLQPSNIQAAPGAKSRVWNNVVAMGGKQPAKLVGMNKWWKYAAAAAVVITAGAGYWWGSNRDVTVTTKYAEKKKIELPDHSIVTLNANSTLRYSNKWNAGKPREVWIDGEAFFEVNHPNGFDVTKESSRFIVHTDQLNVQVLGTSFNVDNRHQVTTVALNNGKVQLDLKNDEGSKIVLAPGDVVTFSAAKKILLNQKAVPDKISAWKNNRLEFDKTPMKEVITMLEDNYGFKVRVEDDEVYNKTISGAVSTENDTILLASISAAINMQLERKGKEIVIRNE